MTEFEKSINIIAQVGVEFCKIIQEMFSGINNLGKENISKKGWFLQQYPDKPWRNFETNCSCENDIPCHDCAWWDTDYEIKDEENQEG